MRQSKIRVAVFDDNPFFRESINILLEERMDMEVSGSFHHANDVLQNVRDAQPDVVLMDIDMPGTTGIQALVKIRKEFSELPVMMLTDYDDDDKVIDSICAGANGYTLKNSTSQKIIDGIIDVYSGYSSLSPTIAKKVMELFSSHYLKQEAPADFGLSPREKDVLVEITKGHSYKIIANNLGITYDTVRAHIKQIYKKLQVNTVSGAVAKALNHRLV
jgi:DNA-binding NarL/FixJ family response regulator